MSVDLYAALGAQRTDDQAAIRKAYRCAAKQAHPDQNPHAKPEAWALVLLAKDVLTDAGRRAKYDATGRIDEPARDNAIAVAMMKIAQHLDKVLQAIEARGAAFEEYDVIADAIRSVREEKADARLLIEKMKADVRKIQDVARRFKARKGKTDRLGPMFAARAADIERAMSKPEETIVACDKAVEILSEHSFEHSPSSGVYGKRMDSTPGTHFQAFVNRWGP